MKALGLEVSDKKIFESFISKIYLFTPWPTYATNRNGLNNFDRGPPRDHSCEVWSKSNKRFQRRCCLKKLLTDARTHGRTTDDGRRTLKDHKSSLFVLRWANKGPPYYHFCEVSSNLVKHLRRISTNKCGSSVFTKAFPWNIITLPSVNRSRFRQCYKKNLT